MIKNDALENRLNAIKTGTDIPTHINESEKPISLKSGEVLNNETKDPYLMGAYLIESLLFIFKSFIYGFTLKTIFIKDWNMVTFFCIGLSVSFIIDSINKFFHK